MTSKLTRERIQRIIRTIDSEAYDEEEIREWLSSDEIMELSRMALAAMDSSESVEMPLDYLHGHKDGLEWAAQLAEANHPDTGDWLYDDPIELAKAIRKGPDMPPVQPAPVVSAELLHTAASAIEDLLTTKDRTGACVWFDLPFRLRSAANAQPAPVVPEEMTPEMMRSVQLNSELGAYAASNLSGAYDLFAEFWKEACRAAMLAAAPQSPGSEPATVPGKWIPVSERMPEDRTQVILWDAEIGEVTSGHYSHKTQTFYHCGDAIENEITHWMLPPSAPQGVKP
ncbi:DUF551 domain-containing protein [Klebsiella variicola]|uniref:DUF551 domain-containing protein n=1 Tax=Klebsiella pneumoniae complex TaxID=3390273 RepID=UPI0007CA6A77|nr:Eaa1 [Klebsiella variicola]SAU70675.1 Eaa1 [Klebsiella variicola]HBW4459773.1 DUF551 domain-containing protein [Klebsiella pneumoniae]HBW5008250.1 DUF551 domain-containing protein [Klebsiella pneumoniae]HEQ2843113.1 DUF551 domain-containing protein [Klebsiella pneumoniae]